MAMHFDLVDLRLMVHIADANSMTRGAELSFISLPAASTRIKNLEESIGTKLLYRTSQGVTLTPPGQAFVSHARMVLGQIEHLRGDMQEYVRGIWPCARVRQHHLSGRIPAAGAAALPAPQPRREHRPA